MCPSAALWPTAITQSAGGPPSRVLEAAKPVWCRSRGGKRKARATRRQRSPVSRRVATVRDLGPLFRPRRLLLLSLRPRLRLGRERDHAHLAEPPAQVAVALG